MKILQIIPYFIPAYSYGGPVKVCFDLSTELVKRGHQVTVVTTDTLDGNNRISNLTEVVNGIKIIRFKNISNSLAKNCNAYLPIGFYSWVKKNIQNYDIVHCHDFFTYQNIVIRYFCKKHNIPFIIQPHGTLSPIRQKAKFKRAKKLFLTLFDKLLKDSQNIIALTIAEKNEISNINKKLINKIKVIPNGLNLKEFKNISKINLHKKYNIPKDDKIIGYIGRLQYIKGIDISLRILSKIKSNLKFTYLIIGPNEGEKEKLKKLINKLGLEKNVIFTGILNGQEKLQTIKSCDLFLFTSRSEGLPMTILEIAALGVPQILSENCNVPEIKQFNAGEVLNLTNRKKLVTSIIDIITSPNTLNTMSTNAKKLSQQKFNLQKICTKFEIIYKNIQK